MTADEADTVIWRETDGRILREINDARIECEVGDRIPQDIYRKILWGADPKIRREAFERATQ